MEAAYTHSWNDLESMVGPATGSICPASVNVRVELLAPTDTASSCSHAHTRLLFLTHLPELHVGRAGAVDGVSVAPPPPPCTRSVSPLTPPEDRAAQSPC